MKDLLLYTGVILLMTLQGAQRRYMMLRGMRQWDGVAAELASGGRGGDQRVVVLSPGAGGDERGAVSDTAWQQAAAAMAFRASRHRSLWRAGL